MEKKKSHYSLKAIQEVFCAPEKLRITGSARSGARALGITLPQMVEIIQNLSVANFYKSMTSDNDSKIWQDVYHAVHNNTALYVKFTIDSQGYLLISFKRK